MDKSFASPIECDLLQRGSALLICTSGLPKERINFLGRSTQSWADFHYEEATFSWLQKGRCSLDKQDSDVQEEGMGSAGVPGDREDMKPLAGHLRMNHSRLRYLQPVRTHTPHAV